MEEYNADAAIDEAGMIVQSSSFRCGSPFLVGSNLRNFKKAITAPMILEGVYFVYMTNKGLITNNFN